MNTFSIAHGRWFVLLAGATLAIALALMVSSDASAGGSPPQCVDLKGMICIEAQPLTESNTVGDDHTVVGSLTAQGEPIQVSDIDMAIGVVDGPNAGELLAGVTDDNGQLALTYTGDGGLGTDTIGVVACIGIENGPSVAGGIFFCQQEVSEFINLCLAAPEECLFNLTDPRGACANTSEFICTVATKDWVAAPTPTPTPAPSATPTVTPTAAPAAALPSTGADPTDGAAFPLAGAIALALGGAALLMGASLLVRRAR